MISKRFSAKNPKARIVEEATTLFSRYGFLGTSMNLLAQRLKIGKPAIYYYFKDKKSLALAVIDNYFQEIYFYLEKEKKKASQSFSFLGLIDSYLSFFEKKKIFLRLSDFKGKGEGELRKKFLLWRKKIRKIFFSSFKNKMKTEIVFIVSLILERIDSLIEESLALDQKIEKEKIKRDVSSLVNFIGRYQS